MNDRGRTAQAVNLTLVALVWAALVVGINRAASLGWLATVGVAVGALFVSGLLVQKALSPLVNGWIYRSKR